MRLLRTGVELQIEKFYYIHIRAMHGVVCFLSGMSRKHSPI